MAQWSDRRQRFRAVLSGGKCVSPASVFDPMTARMAEDIGFECGILAGSTASMTVLGAPDLIVLTLTEFAEQALRISRAAELPLLVDADHGYGNALNVMRTVQELETAGVAALSIEDTDLPPPYGAATGARLLPLEEGLGKVKAAIAAKSDPDLVVCGRTSAAKVEGTDACCARVRAYSQAGCDAIFLVGVPDRTAMEAIAAETDLPIIIGGAGPDLADHEYLASLGVRIRLTGHKTITAAMQAAFDALKAERDGTAMPSLASPELVRQTLRQGNYDGWIRDFLGG